jgi:hypothetical protein
VRYEEAQDPADLDRAIAACRAAVEGHPSEAARRGELLGALGTLQMLRFTTTGAPEDIDSATRLCREAVATADRGSPSRIITEAQLAQVLAARFDALGEPSDAQEAVELFRAATRSDQAAWTDARRGAAFTWSSWAATRADWSQAAEAYRAALALARDLLTVQLTPAGTRTWLQNFGAYSAGAGYAMVRADDPEGALLALDTGRAVALSRALDLQRADLTRLEADDRADLAARFRAAAQHVQAATAADPARSTLDPVGQA